MKGPVIDWAVLSPLVALTGGLCIVLMVGLFRASFIRRAVVPVLTLVCLGVTAANAVLGRRVTITAARGRAWDSRHGVPAFVTVHPSAILRIREDADRDVEMGRFVEDLEQAARAAAARD